MVSSHNKTAAWRADTIGELIRRQRRRAGQSQYQLADRLATLSGNSAITRDQVARWERGKRIPGRYWQHWLSEALDVPAPRLAMATLITRAQRDDNDPLLPDSAGHDQCPV